jgi:hypothetical protein
MAVLIDHEQAIAPTKVITIDGAFPALLEPPSLHTHRIASDVISVWAK